MAQRKSAASAKKAHNKKYLQKVSKTNNSPLFKQTIS